ncbi:2-hydroxyacyl-CoA dehydratase family protein [uncultured Thiodictyon sp.]|uniref:2-hydroxyacyl-CoA dehydratase subunit D n=1 Tax=uncultured Thiodictyon sp. TaxID=1846217 RepID=UPI0025DCE763|nr:2-hydroxyacyl-CoA dehydratase family protein [uncultured Thiodictyon sp.]
MALNALELIYKRLRERPQELVEARANGAKVVGFQAYNLPEEVIYALGLIPVRLGSGGDGDLVEVGGRYISTKNCVYVRSTVGLFAENTDPYIVNSDIVAFDATCLQTFRTAEVVQYYFNREVIILGVPRNFYLQEAHTYFAAELRHFVSRLEAISGVTLTRERLADSIALYNGIRDAIVRIYPYQATKNPAISWEQVFDVIQAGYVLDRREYLGLLESLLAELVQQRGAPVIGGEDDEARIFISGSTIPPGDKKLISIMQELGGRIVGDDLWSGLIPYVDVQIEDATLEALASAYLNRTPHGALPYLELATDRRIKRLKELITTFKANGVIYHTLRYCDPYTFKAKETKDILEKEGIPLLELHTEYAGSDFEAIRTRVEAFVEMVKLRAESEEAA